MENSESLILSSLCCCCQASSFCSAMDNSKAVLTGFNRPRSVTYPPNQDDVETLEDLADDLRPRSQSQTDGAGARRIKRINSKRAQDRRRSLSDPTSPGNSLAKFLKNVGLG